MKKELNFAIVGVGYWGPNYARLLNEIDGVNLLWCCDTDENALAKMKRRFPQTKTTTKLKELLDDPALDCVVVVTPAQTHYKIAKACLEHGKHTLVEKPLTLRSKDSADLKMLAKKNKLTLSVDHIFKFNSGLQKLRDLIKSEHLGEVYYVYGLYNALGPIRKEVSAMWDLAHHFIYATNFILGLKPKSVSAFGRGFLQKSIEDVVFLNLEYPNKILLNLHTSWLDPVKVRQLVVVGSKRMVILDDVSTEGKVKIYDKSALVNKDPNFANLQIVLREGDILIPKIENKEPLKENVIDFVESIHLNRRPQADGEEGEEVVKILEAAQRSLKSGKRMKIVL